jgi:hypothetical protein
MEKSSSLKMLLKDDIFAAIFFFGEFGLKVFRYFELNDFTSSGE